MYISKKKKKGIFITLLIIVIIVAGSVSLWAFLRKVPTGADIDGEFVRFDDASEMFDMIPQKTGYTFDGWVYFVDNKPKKVTADSFSKKIEKETFYATWKPIEYTVTFYADGAEVGTSTYSLEKKPTMPNIPEKQGYSAAWEEHEFTTGEVSINAVYTPLNYNIAYENLFGATNNNSATYTYGTEYTLVKPEREGYDFDGWFDREGSKIEKVEKGSSGDLVFSAKWVATPYTIEYTNTKGASLGDIPTEYTVESAGFSLPSLSTSGYTFDGWYNVGTKVDKIESGTKGNLRLEARWAPVEYSITYYNVEGWTNDNPVSYTVEDEKIVLNEASKYWYVFNGWYSNASLTERVTEIDVSSMKNISLYADWSMAQYNAYYYDGENLVHTQPFNVENTKWIDPAVPEKLGYSGSWSNYTVTPSNLKIFAKRVPSVYNISYVDSKGVANENISSYTIESSTIELKPLTANGYNFLGWYDGNQLVTEIANGSYGDREFTARWEIAVYSITYENLKDAEVEGLVYSYTIESETITLPSEISATGYTFKGWICEKKYIQSIEKGSFGNKVIQAALKPNIYKVTYENEGNAINLNSPEYTILTGLVLNPISQYGYDFLGWFSGDELVTEIPKGEYGDRTFTAKWHLATYPIIYLDTKDADISSFVSEYTIESETIVLPNELSVNGYTFNGWLNDNGERIDRIEKGSFGNKIVKAELTPIEYTVVYEEVGESINENKLTYTIESGLVLNPLTRDGFSFLGWYSGNDLVTEIQVGEYGNRNLTAKWDIATYQITYNNTKGVDTSAFVKEYTIESQRIVLPLTLSVDGYVFKGWKDTNGERIDAIEQGSFGNVELTADFSPIIYNISYNDTFDAINLNPQRYTIEDSIKLTSLQRKGYAFMGWYQGNELVSSIDEGSLGNIVLTAKWELAVYTITYTSTFGADTSEFVSSYTIETETISLPMDLKVSGYTFNGWKDKTGSIVTEIYKGSYGDIVLTADLHPTTYVITLEAMDGKVDSHSVTVLYGEDFTLPVPTYANGTFLGWYNNTGDNATSMTDANGNSINAYPYRNSITLYAHYFVEVFTITFDTDGGTAIPAQNYSCGSLFDESAAKTERGSDLFDGWYDAMGTKFVDGTPITASVTLKAKWTESVGISDLDGLLAISENPSGKYHLMNDINLRGNLWTPIENFSGVLDGKGYSLKNFNLSCTSYTPNFAFIKVNEGSVKNLEFEDFSYNVSINTTNSFIVGVFISENKGVIENCVVNSGLIKLDLVAESTSKFESTKKFGIFAGENKESGLVKHCDSKVGITITPRVTNQYWEYGYYFTITLNIYCGGIVGNNFGIIENCNFKSSINMSTTASGNFRGSEHRADLNVYLGGVVGWNQRSAVCQNSYVEEESIMNITNGEYAATYSYIGGLVGVNAGTISSCRSAGRISDGAYHIGGLVGQNMDKANIVSCYSSVNVDINAGGDIGGFVGNNAGIIQNSYAKGSITSMAGGNIAGFVGNNGSTGSITKCYSNGGVSAANGNVGYFVGSSSGTLFKCYYLKSVLLSIGGEKKDNFTEYETVNGLLNQTLWSKEFLVDEMYWEEEGWIILTNDNPVLSWEISIDDCTVTVFEPNCEEMGYTVYVEKTTGRFFIRNYVSAWGHSYDYNNVKVVDSTCNAKGYEEYICTRCSHVERMNYTDATGHTVGNEIEHKDPTCEEIGYTIHSCAVCGVELRTEIPALGHTPVVTVERTNPVCGKTESGEFIEEDGLTERIECSVCHIVLQEQTVVKPHDYVLTNTITAPTCTENGLGTYTCRFENCGRFSDMEIPALGHTDLNKDHMCDVCKALIDDIYEGETVIEIKTPEDLLNISSNLNGVYRLMNDIDMLYMTWISLGSEEKPFTGYFDGNGKTIKNLCGVNQSAVPMFGNLRGIVYNLTLNYEKGATVDLSANGNMGLLANTNDGSIVSCKIVGVVNVNFRLISESAEFKDTNQLATVIFGGFVYMNGAEGVILDSTVSATFNVMYTHQYMLNTDWSISVLTSRNYRFHHTSVVNIYFSGVAGINNGNIQGCSVTGKVEHGAGKEGAATAKVKDSNGHVHVTTNVYFDSVVAINNNAVENCETTLIFTAGPSRSALRYFAEFWSEEENFNLTIDGNKQGN